MPSFNNLSKLYSYIENSVDSSLKYVGEIVKTTIKKYVDSEVYSQPQGNYTRTYDLINSIEVFNISKIEKGKYEVSIGWSWENIQSHTTILGGSSYNYNPNDKIPVALVAYSLENGYTWNRSESNFLGLTYEELINTNIHINALKEQLIKKGIIVK